MDTKKVLRNLVDNHNKLASIVDQNTKIFQGQINDYFFLVEGKLDSFSKTIESIHSTLHQYKVNHLITMFHLDRMEVENKTLYSYLSESSLDMANFKQLLDKNLQRDLSVDSNLTPSGVMKINHYNWSNS